MLPSTAVVRLGSISYAPLPERSRCFSLVPFGVRTAHVEALSSYFISLAQAHAISPATLASELFRGAGNFSRIENPGGYLQFNGFGPPVRDRLAVLEQATKRGDLCFLTLLQFDGLLSLERLFRRVRAWCPDCLDEMRRGGALAPYTQCDITYDGRLSPFYEPMLWSIAEARCCPIHRRLFVTVCQACGKASSPIGRNSRPGFCAHCQTYLGRARPTHNASESDIQSSRLIGEFLALPPEIDATSIRASLEEAISSRAHELTGGNLASLSNRYLGPYYALHGLFSRGTGFRMEKLVNILLRLQIPVRSLVSGELPKWASAAPEPSRAATIFSRPQRTPAQLRALFHDLAHQQPNSSPLELALQLGYTNESRLRLVDPELYAEVAQRARSCRRTRQDFSYDTIERALRDAYGQAMPTPIAVIAHKLGCSEKPLRTHFPELCNAISRKRRSRQPFSPGRIRQGLKRAMRKRPPASLSDVARELGIATSNTLRYHEPKLCDELVAARKAFLVETSLSLRKRVNPLLRLKPPLCVREACSRLKCTKAYLRKYCPDLLERLGERFLKYRRTESKSFRGRIRQEVAAAVTKLRFAGERITRAVVADMSPTTKLYRNWKVFDTAYKHALANTDNGSDSQTRRYQGVAA
jgi:hypothetical protein